MQKRLTEEQISLIAHNIDDGDWNDIRFRNEWYRGFKEGFSEAEKEYNIGETVTIHVDDYNDLIEAKVFLDCLESGEAREVRDKLADIYCITKHRDELLLALEKFMDAHEECTDFDGFTAQIVSMDDYHEAQDTITRVKGTS